MADNETPQCTLVRELHHFDTNELLFVFLEFPDKVLSALKVTKQIPPPLEVIKMDDTGHSLVGVVKPMSANLQDTYLLFDSSYLNTRVSVMKQKRIKTVATRHK